MNVEHFKGEFSELIRRFAAKDCVIMDKNLSAAVAPLTSQEIIEAIDEVLSSKLDVTLVDPMRSQATTPASEIVMIVPDAPDIPKLQFEHNGGMARRIRSFDALWSENLTDPSIDKPIIAEPSSLVLKVDNNIDAMTIDVPDIGAMERKLRSKSTPEVNTLIRSDTFVREDAFESVKNGDVFEKNNFDSLMTNGGNRSEHSMQDLSEIMKKLKVLRESANDVVKKIDDIHKGVPVNCRPIRRLSAMGGFPELNRVSLTGKPIQRPKVARRSMLAAFPGTPTSSRLSPDLSKVKSVCVTRKSTLTIPVIDVESTKLTIPSKYRSVSSSDLTAPRKSVTRYDSPTHRSQALGVNTKKKLSCRSPSLTSLNIKSRLGSQQPKTPIFSQPQTPKEGIALKKRKAY